MKCIVSHIRMSNVAYANNYSRVMTDIKQLGINHQLRPVK